MQIVRFCFLALCLSFFPFIGKAQTINQIAPLQKTLTGNVADGFIFITQTALDTVGPYPSAIALLDSVGNYVFFKGFTKRSSAPYKPSGISDFKIQPSGLLSFSIAGKGMYLMDSNFSIVDSIKCTNGFNTDGHDFIHLPNGSYHLAGTEERTLDLSNLQTDNGNYGSTQATVIGNVIQRFDAQKNLQFEWKSLDHFTPADVYQYYFTDPTRLDHSHYNSLEIDNDGNYMLSFRHLNEITKIDSSSGQIIWRFGGKNNQFTFLGDTTKFTAQHDARRIVNGNITLFDNATFSNGLPARAVEYHLDETNMTANLVQQFSQPNGLSSQFIGNSQRLQNGNTLIDWGGAFPLSQSVSFTEVDNSSSTVLALDFLSSRYVSYRAVKHQLPFTINRPAISCDQATQTLSAPSGYSHYEWNTGDTTQTISISSIGNYQVWTNYGIGMISSPAVHISDITSICSSIGLDEAHAPRISFYPNPIDEYLNISYPSNLAVNLKVLNSWGKLIISKTIQFDTHASEQRINLSQLSPGVYFLQFGEQVFRFVKS